MYHFSPCHRGDSLVVDPEGTSSLCSSSSQDSQMFPNPWYWQVGLSLDISVTFRRPTSWHSHPRHENRQEPGFERLSLSLALNPQWCSSFTFQCEQPTAKLNEWMPSRWTEKVCCYYNLWTTSRQHFTWSFIQNNCKQLLISDKVLWMALSKHNPTLSLSYNYQKKDFKN